MLQEVENNFNLSGSGRAVPRPAPFSPPAPLVLGGKNLWTRKPKKGTGQQRCHDSPHEAVFVNPGSFYEMGSVGAGFTRSTPMFIYADVHADCCHSKQK
jgi:hypothetical protein